MKKKIPYLKILILTFVLAFNFTLLFTFIIENKKIDADIQLVEVKNKEETFKEIWNLSAMFNSFASDSKKFDEEKKIYEYYAPKNNELYSECFTDPETYIKFRKNGILNKYNLFDISMLLEKCYKLKYNDKIAVISFIYKGEEIKFPIGIGITRKK